MAYSKEQDDFLREIAKECGSWKELGDEFIKKYGSSYTVCGITQHAAKILHVKIASVKDSMHFTDEENEWLRQHYSEHDSYASLTAEFNQTFNHSKSKEAVAERCTKRLKIKGIQSSTTFKKGHIQEQCPLGTIKRCSNGTDYIKTQETSGTEKLSGYCEPYWMPLQKKIYQDHYGEIPKGAFVIFLDGNHDNLDISNLYCVDRKILCRMAQNKWYTDSREHTLTGVKWCELFCALKEQVR